MGFLKQEYWSGLPFYSPGDLPDPGLKPVSFVSPALAGKFFITEPPGCLKDMLSILKCTSQYSLTPPPTLPQRHTQSSKKMEIMPRFRSRALGEPGPHRSGTCMYFILSVF